MISVEEVKRIKEMAELLDQEYIAKTFNLPIVVVEDVLRGNIKGEDTNAQQGMPVKIIEKATYVRNKTVAVVAPGGGKGKTSLIASLTFIASLTVPEARPVLAMDLTEYGKLPLHFGLGLGRYEMMPNIAQCSDSIDRDELFGYLSVQSPEIENLHLIPGVPVADMHKEIPLDKTQKLITAAQKYFDIIFIDTPAGMDMQDVVLASADTIVIVTGDDYPGVAGVAQLLPTLERLGKLNQFHLVVNKRGPETVFKPGQFQRVMDDILQVSIPVAAWLPYEARLVGWLNGMENQHCVFHDGQYRTEILRLLTFLCPDWGVNQKTQDSPKGFLNWFKATR